MQTLTTLQIEQARNLAYFLALKRGYGKIPRYEPESAYADFVESAGHAALYEPDPDDKDADRLVPVALRQHPQFKSFDTNTAAKYEYICNDLSGDEYWTVLGHIWVHSPKKNTDFKHEHSQRFRRLFGSPHAGREKVMTPNERFFLRSRSGTLKIYRGCQKKLNERGLSWTFKLPVAIDFAREYYGANKVYLTGECATTDVIAYFDFSKEFEVIIHGEKVNVTSTDPVPYPIPDHLLRR